MRWIEVRLNFWVLRKHQRIEATRNCLRLRGHNRSGRLDDCDGMFGEHKGLAF